MPGTPVLAVWNTTPTLHREKGLMYVLMIYPLGFKHAGRTEQANVGWGLQMLYELRTNVPETRHIRSRFSICVSQSCGAPVEQPVSRVGSEAAAGESRTSMTFSITPQLSYSQLLPKHQAPMRLLVCVIMCDCEWNLSSRSLSEGRIITACSKGIR